MDSKTSNRCPKQSMGGLLLNKRKPPRFRGGFHKDDSDSLSLGGSVSRCDLLFDLDYLTGVLQFLLRNRNGENSVLQSCLNAFRHRIIQENAP